MRVAAFVTYPSGCDELSSPGTLCLIVLPTGALPLSAECGLVVLQACSQGCMAAVLAAQVSNGVA